MISSRYALPVILLLALALVPTIIHSYIGATVVDGLTTRAIEVQFDRWQSEPTSRKASWVEPTFDTSDWMERRYHGPDGENVLLFVARSYDLKRLYHHPEIGILRGVDLESEGTVQLPPRPDVKVHIFRERVGGGMAGYALMYDGRFVENPVAMQLQSSLEMLFSPRKEMTLFLVYEDDLPRGSDFGESGAAHILMQAIDRFNGQGK